MQISARILVGAEMGGWVGGWVTCRREILEEGGGGGGGALLQTRSWVGGWVDGSEFFGLLISLTS